MDSYDAPPRQPRNDTLIFHRLNDLTCLWYIHTKQLAKLDRYTIGQKVFEHLIDLLVVTAQAQFQVMPKKATSLRLIIPTLDTTKILVRLSRKLEILDEHEYIRYEQELHEIGRMIGGWIRDLENKLGSS